MNSQMLTGIKPGIRVLIDGRKHEARGVVADGRMFIDVETGDETYLTSAQQRLMASEWRLVLADLPKNIEDGIARGRAANFAAYDATNRTIALRRLQYVREVHNLPPKMRRRKSEIDKCILTVHARLIEQNTVDFTPWLTDHEDSGEAGEYDEATIVPDQDSDARRRSEIIEEKLLKLIARDTSPADQKMHVLPMPTARRVRRWYRLYYSSGQDIRVLLNHDANKGNRRSRYEDWVVDAVTDVIDDKIAVPTPAKFSAALNIACQAVRDAKPPEATLPVVAANRGGQRLLGKNLIARWVAKRDRFELATTQVGIFEARRRFSAVELGPQGDYPNHQWEVDHTPLDLFVIDEDSQHVYGRPYLTAILDRYTRCIVGFSLSFAPPSWISVGDALRIALADKRKLIEHINASVNPQYQIRQPWDCRGIPKYLITDHGREFKSNSMDETLSVLNTIPVQTKKRKPWLKGKIERWFRTLEEDFIHTIPGTTLNIAKRKFYPSEEFAVVTLPEINWIVLKWVVDVYNQRPHRKLRLSPAEMWRRGAQHVAPRELPPELLRPTMGLVLDRVLRRTGVSWANMRWDSREFANLRARLKNDAAAVQIRLDPRDLRTIYAWDPTQHRWIEGTLKEPIEAGDYSLEQWYYIDTKRKELMQSEGYRKQEAIEQAIVEIDAFIKDIAQGLTNSKAYKRYLVNVHRKRSAWEMMLPEHWDGSNDGPPGAHTLGPSPMLATMQTGPYRESRPPPIADCDGPASTPTDDDATERPIGSEGPTAKQRPRGEDATAPQRDDSSKTSAETTPSEVTEPAPDPVGNNHTLEPSTTEEPYSPKPLRGSFSIRRRSET